MVPPLLTEHKKLYGKIQEAECFKKSSVIKIRKKIIVSKRKRETIKTISLSFIHLSLLKKLLRILHDAPDSVQPVFL